MAIVKYTAKDGTQYAYSSESRWDPELKNNRPVRKYLGKVNPVTGEIIPSSGQRGRKKGSTNKPKEGAAPQEGQKKPQETSAEDGAQTENSGDGELAALREQFRQLQQENEALKKRVQGLENILRLIRDEAAEVSGE